MPRHLRLLALAALTALAAPAAGAGSDDAPAAPIPARRPTVAVVLAGGGAKGVAHITALSVIEQAGIPIDIVVGNSMGSLLGGLYSAGYTTDELQRLVTQQDWMQLLLDNPNYGRKGLDVLRQNERYLLQVPIDQSLRQTAGRASGVLSGGNVVKLLREQLLPGLADSIDFHALPIPFACVATEAQTGRVHEFHSGDLVMAMRSSMAIPFAFTPVRADSLVFVDGGVTNNFPVDVARRMGADVIIGLDLVTGQTAAQLTTNAADIVTHLLDVAADPLYQSNIRACDVYIPLDASGYTAASFTPTAIDTLLRRGERSARRHFAELIDLKTRRLGLPADWRPAPVAPIDTMAYWGRTPAAGHPAPADDHADNPLRRGYRGLRDAYMDGAVLLGVRFDNYEHASLLLGAHVDLNERYNMALNARLRLGKRLNAAAYIHYRLWNIEDVNLGYEFDYDKPSFYDHGKRSAEYTDAHHTVQLYVGHTTRRWDYRFGLRYDVHALGDVLLGTADGARQWQGFRDKTERYITYFAHGEFNTLNSTCYPTQGIHAELSAELVSDDFYKYRGQQLVPILAAYLLKPISPNTRFTLSPTAQARFAFFDTETPLTQRNYVGGLFRRQLRSYQMTMAGLAYPELMPDFVLSAGLRAQQRIGANHFVTAALDVGAASDRLDRLTDGDAFLWGFNFGYTFRSLAGPLSAQWFWNDRTHDTAFLINLGFGF